MNNYNNAKKTYYFPFVVYYFISVIGVISIDIQQKEKIPLAPRLQSQTHFLMTPVYAYLFNF